MNRLATAPAVDAGVLKCECAEELVEHLAKLTTIRGSAIPRALAFTDVLREPEFAPRDDGGGAADPDALDVVGRPLRLRVESRRTPDLGAL